MFTLKTSRAAGYVSLIWRVKAVPTVKGRETDRERERETTCLQAGKQQSLRQDNEAAGWAAKVARAGWFQGEEAPMDKVGNSADHAPLFYVLGLSNGGVRWLRRLYRGGLYKLGTGQACLPSSLPLPRQALPVLQLSCHSFGDAPTHQADHKEDADAHTDH